MPLRRRLEKRRVVRPEKRNGALGLHLRLIHWRLCGTGFQPVQAMQHAVQHFSACLCVFCANLTFKHTTKERNRKTTTHG